MSVYIIESESGPHFALMSAELAERIGAKPGPKVKKPRATKKRK